MIIIITVIIIAMIIMIKIIIIIEDIEIELVGMEFGIEKCAMLVMEKGKIVKSVGIELPHGKVIESLQEGESYKYLGILVADKFLEEKMKLNVSK